MSGGVIPLSPFDLGLAAILVVALALLSTRMGLGIGRSLLVAGLRTTVQLLLVGLVLEVIFGSDSLLWVALLATMMLAAAGREVVARQQRRFMGWWAFGFGTLSMFISSFTVTVLALNVVIATEPWWTPQYAIPLLGMLLGNTMNGIALAMDRLTGGAWQQRAVIEQRLMVGQTWDEAVGSVRQEAMRVGMIPMINAMAAAGIVSLPGMMTGQILSGTPPIEAVKYQILIMFLITAGAGFGTMAAVWLGARRLFDERERLRVDRLHTR